MGYRPLRASAPSNNDGLNQPLLQAQPPPMPNQPPPMPNPVHAPGRRNCISLCKSIRCPVRGPCRPGVGEDHTKSEIFTHSLY